MRHKLLTDAAERTFIVVMDNGDEVMSALESFCAQQGITAARFTAIGAFSSATLGYFDWERKDYDRIALREQVEVLTLTGDVTDKDGQPALHAHVVIGKRDGTAHGGHLLDAYVRPTLELMLIESPSCLRRTHDPESGLPLIDLGASGTP